MKPQYNLGFLKVQRLNVAMICAISEKIYKANTPIPNYSANIYSIFYFMKFCVHIGWV